jgi:hypothetical protein
LPAARRLQALRRVAQRYARALRISFNDLQNALSVASSGTRSDRAARDSEERDLDSEPQDTLI